MLLLANLKQYRRLDREVDAELLEAVGAPNYSCALNSVAKEPPSLDRDESLHLGKRLSLFIESGNKPS